MNRAEIIETMARAIHDADWGPSAWLAASIMERYESEMQATAALSALEAAELAVVPVEPTEEMYRSAYKVQDDCAIKNYGGSPTADDYWTAMIAAAHGSHKP